MKRLLAAVGLAAVVCLVLILSACTDGVLSPEENPLSDRADTVSGKVSLGGDPIEDADVWIYYWDGPTRYDACVSGDTTDQYGYYEIDYIQDALGFTGKAYAWIMIGPIKWDGWSDVFWYPNAEGPVTDIDIELTP